MGYVLLPSGYVIITFTISHSLQLLSRKLGIINLEATMNGPEKLLGSRVTRHLIS